MICTGWQQPRRVDAWWWMESALYDDDGLTMIRSVTCTWNADGSDHYGVFVGYEREGYGFHSWPQFRALADAQGFGEILLGLSVAEATELQGRLEGRYRYVVFRGPAFLASARAWRVRREMERALFSEGPPW